MALVRYSFLNTPAFLKFLDTDNRSKFEGALNAMAYLVCREEGFVQVSIDQIDNRASILKKLHAVLPNLFGSVRSEVVLLSEFEALGVGDNPLQKGFPLVQMCVDGKRRVGVTVPTPVCDTVNWGSHGLIGLNLPAAVRTDHPGDIQQLKAYFADMPAPPKLPDAAFQSPASKKSKAASFHDGAPSLPASSASGLADKEDGEGCPADERQEASADDDDDLMYPKGRLGNAVRKMDAKLASIMLEMTTPQWRAPLREPTVRSLRRAASDNKTELESSEHPQLLQRTVDHLATITELLNLTNGLIAYSKDNKSANLAKLHEPLEILLTVARGKHPQRRFDPELMNLKVV